MEEDEEELYSEMQLEDGGRRRPSGTSHNALKVSTELMPGCPKSRGCSLLPFMVAFRSYLLLLSVLPRGSGYWHLGDPFGTPGHSQHCSGKRTEPAQVLTCSHSRCSFRVSSELAVWGWAPRSYV